MPVIKITSTSKGSNKGTCSFLEKYLQKENLDKEFSEQSKWYDQERNYVSRGEVVNRIDETVVFHPLQQEQIRGIADIQLQLLNKRLADSELRLEPSAAVLDHLAKVGYDPVYGARPLKRAVQNLIENSLAQHVLQGDYVPGDIITVTLDVAGKLVFGKAAQASAAAVA